jgi:hypothetical protein
MPSGAEPSGEHAIEIPPDRPARSKLPLAIGALAVVAVAVIVIFALPRGGSTPAPAPVPPAGSAAVTTPPPVPPDAAVAVKPVSPAIITVEGVPDGTEVSIAGTAIGVAPGPVQVPHADSAVVLTFKADGYLSMSKTLTPDRDQRVELQLKKKPRATSSGTKPSKDDIIDVFGGKKQP